MKKYFNIAADCKPQLHYMVNMESRLEKVKEYIARGEYFMVSRARQYGKTTMLRALRDYLRGEYVVVGLDFQTQMSNAKFRDENIFSAAFAKAFVREICQSAGAEISVQMQAAVDRLVDAAQNSRAELELVELFLYLSDICAVCGKPIVLTIDEVDSASNNQVFLDFLAQLRGYYIDRDRVATFQSVILAGVYDIKNLKRKFRTDEEHKVNSPWNIAADFNIDMSFSRTEIAGMLGDYESDYCTGMDIEKMSELLYEFTSGYPFLVSRLCKLIDEAIAGSKGYPTRTAAWTHDGFMEAEKLLLAEKNTLFESMVNKLYDYPELKEMVHAILFTGREIPYNPLNPVTEIAAMFGFIKNKNGSIIIANRIFETVFYNFYLAMAEVQNTEIYKAALCDKSQFVCGGRLNMELILEKFVRHFDDLYGDQSDKFKEEDGRRYFLLYLKPIINGTGNYYIESRTRNMERTDVIVDYAGEQFVIELKIWRGNAYNERGQEQLAEYLEHYHLKKGYMLSFNFNKKKEIGIKRTQIEDKTVVEAIV